MGVTHVVNCTDNMPQFHERDTKEPKITYLRFPTSFWMQHERKLPEFIRRESPRHMPARHTRALEPNHRHCVCALAALFEFVDGALAKGESVLVHCLAGAHRAGTTGCMLLMYKVRTPPFPLAALATTYYQLVPDT